jgi:putative restriction endonuclease
VAATRGYFAVAKVAQVIANPKAPGMYLALIERGSYLDFVNPVPFNGPDGVIEQGVLNAEGRISGRAQVAGRPLSAADFNRILSMGLAEDQLELSRSGEPMEAPSSVAFSDSVQVPFVFEQERDRVTQLSSRIVRDRLFAVWYCRLTTKDAR